MSYNEELAGRIRKHLAATPEVTERKMFGGLAFLINGNMAVAANRNGGLMVRVDPDTTEDLLDTTPARPVEMRGRQLRGWLHLDSEDVADDPGLIAWIEIGRAHAATVSSKPSSARQPSRKIVAEGVEYSVGNLATAAGFEGPDMSQ